MKSGSLHFVLTSPSPAHSPPTSSNTVVTTTLKIFKPCFVRVYFCSTKIKLFKMQEKTMNILLTIKTAMKCVLYGGGMILTPIHAFSQAPLTATEIVQRSDDLLRDKASYARVTMSVIRPEWKRTVVMEAWTEGTQNTLIRTLAPAKEKGVTFLKKGREAWNYIPSIDRTIKIPPSMMLQSWMGSDFTNDDLVRADSLVVDYDHVIKEETEKKGMAYWLIEARPKLKAPVVWGHILLTIRKPNFVPDRVEYYDEDGGLAKYYKILETQTIEEKEVATTFSMHDVTRLGYQTILRYENLTFIPTLRRDTFTLKNLER
ncbi:MAG: outer membrane lipoprotein-sorting protein [Kiritimatiellae bacterium]|nr:outer membrane lipoprotein-sorting protein [Kiritimatiellia bacterium]